MKTPPALVSLALDISRMVMKRESLRVFGRIKKTPSRGDKKPTKPAARAYCTRPKSLAATSAQAKCMTGTGLAFSWSKRTCEPVLTQSLAA
ncbi:hypothetical protein [Mesorhizobium sp.]|uniref:hypothetical protein n=1 Tax=Mesorhizobium sp. TaxID=1871066 RepID=UPI0025BDAF44|nr:hypothetical protein [Mesorhizobium sp.]